MELLGLNLPELCVRHDEKAVIALEPVPAVPRALPLYAPCQPVSMTWFFPPTRWATDIWHSISPKIKSQPSPYQLYPLSSQATTFESVFTSFSLQLKLFLARNPNSPSCKKISRIQPRFHFQYWYSGLPPHRLSPWLQEPSTYFPCLGFGPLMCTLYTTKSNVSKWIFVSLLKTLKWTYFTLGKSKFLMMIFRNMYSGSFSI